MISYDLWGANEEPISYGNQNVTEQDKSFEKLNLENREFGMNFQSTNHSNENNEKSSRRLKR